ncbi:probable carboxylesterase SOBER1-like isoform X1 [Raphanus sativus]|uniref:Probable carboxylesterase SOBER1-like isoform X1 n=1 Tax=Raphanus sativus TaxID=3726 RepID=A0A9W3DIU2_RAPSA|nr:probable carboxylesterase SOBER1-like isoform X1 [Raphanus sativus]
MRTSTLTKPIVLFSISLLSTVLFFAFFFEDKPYSSSSPSSSDSMARRTFILWLHGLGDSGPANEPIKSLFKSPEFTNTKWLFPSAPPNPVSCNHGMVMPSWFDIRELPLTAGSPNDESSVLEAVKNVHAVIDKEIAGGIKPENVYICGFSQGGALTLASALLYPKTLGGGAVFSGWVPFNSSVINQFTKDAIKVSICCCFFLFLVKFFIFLVTVFNFLCICRRQSCGLMGLMTRLYYSKLVKQLFLSFNKLVSLVNLRHIQILDTRLVIMSFSIWSHGSNRGC